MGIILCDGIGSLTINGFNLATRAWLITDLYGLMLGSETRGGNSLIPGADGVIAHPLRVTETTTELPMIVVGECGPDGTPYVEAPPYRVGFETNLTAILNGCVTPSGAASVLGEFVTPSGAERSQQCQVLRLREGKIVDGHDLLDGSEGLAMLATLVVKWPKGVPV